MSALHTFVSVLLFYALGHTEGKATVHEWISLATGRWWLCFLIVEKFVCEESPGPVPGAVSPVSLFKFFFKTVKNTLSAGSQGGVVVNTTPPLTEEATPSMIFTEPIERFI